jgi:phosphopantothenate synthetase
MELLMARSLAGHEKGEYYVVLGEDGRDVILVNGGNRTMDKPKRKRRCHVQPIIRFPEEISRMAEEISRWDDENVRKVIKKYNSNRHEKGAEISGSPDVTPIDMRRKESVKSGCN